MEISEWFLSFNGDHSYKQKPANWFLKSIGGRPDQNHMTKSNPSMCGCLW